MSQAYGPGPSTPCPKCGTLVQPGVRFCPSCGNPMGGGPASTPGTPCPKCGTNIPAGSKFCPNCGTAAQTSRTCPKCNQTVTGSPKFCPNCGAAMGG